MSNSCYDVCITIFTILELHLQERSFSDLSENLPFYRSDMLEDAMGFEYFLSNGEHF